MGCEAQAYALRSGIKFISNHAKMEFLERTCSCKGECLKFNSSSVSHVDGRLSPKQMF